MKFISSIFKTLGLDHGVEGAGGERGLSEVL